MEHNAEFMNAVERIQSLEHQLGLCGKAVKEYDECGTQAEILIEAHFEKCLNILAARKAFLLDSIKQKVTNHSMNSTYIIISLT